MKRVFTTISLMFLLLLSGSEIYAKPIVNSQKTYRIASVLKNAAGSIKLDKSGDITTIVYDESISGVFPGGNWKIVEYREGIYQIRSAETNELLMYMSDQNGVSWGFSETVQGLATRFKMEHNMVNGRSYYAIYTCVDEVSDHCITVGEENALSAAVFDESDSQYFVLIDTEDDSWVIDTDIQEALDPAKFLSQFTLDGKSLIYDKNSNLCLFPLPSEQMNTSVSKFIRFPEEIIVFPISVTIEGVAVNNGDKYTFTDVNPNKTYTVNVELDGKDFGSYTIVFTGLPIVQLYIGGGINRETFTAGTIWVHEPSKSLPTQEIKSKYRIRGNYSAGFPKKSYAVKLVDDDGVKLDKSFFGLRSDNNWILDAMFIDPGRARNRVSTDLWNDFAVLPYYSDLEPEMINGTRGQYVEVFMNDQYWGLYCMTEKIDRKQLKLKKYQEDTQTIRGLLYKGKDWSSATLMIPYSGWGWGWNWDNYSNGYDSWFSFEAKYPDLGDGELIDWKPLRDALYFGYSAEGQTLASGLDTYFDIPLLIDYYLFMELLLMTDNHGKNVYYSIYNTNITKKVVFTPWDLDGVWGRRWDGSSNLTVPAQNFQSFLNTHEHSENGLYKKLINGNILQFKTRLAERYLELRKTWFKPENLIKRLAEYKELFEKTGVAAREEQTWVYTNRVEIDFAAEYEYMSGWITSRIAYLDNQYEEFLTASPITKDDAPGLMVYPNPVIDLVTISGVNAGENVSIYDAQGRLIYQEKAQDDNITINMSIYKTGWYIVRAGNKSEMIIKN